MRKLSYLLYLCIVIMFFFSCLITECSVDMLDQRVADLSSVLDKLRSVSTKDQDLSKSTNKASSSDWKVCFFFWFLLCWRKTFVIDMLL